MPPYSLRISMITFLNTALNHTSYMVPTVARTKFTRIPANRRDMMEENLHLPMEGEIILTPRTFIHSLSWGFCGAAIFNSRQV